MTSAPSRSSTTRTAGLGLAAGRTSPGSWWCATPARRWPPAASCPPTRWRSRKSSCHWSCWSPPGEPHASTGCAVAQHQGRASAWSAAAGPGPARTPAPPRARTSASGCRGRSPSSGMVGELCSQPPLGVAEIMLPHRSTTSTWQVSPRVTPSGTTVGSPVVGVAGAAAAAQPGPARMPRAAARARPGWPGRSSQEARPADQGGALGGVRRGEQGLQRRRPPRRRTRPRGRRTTSLSTSATAWMPSAVDGSSAAGSRGRRARRRRLQQRRALAPRTASWRRCDRCQSIGRRLLPGRLRRRPCRHR